eukprot:CAMPEP_0184714286 /NCGR_PEP_ID=MMETSP0314-20130426/4450_1 /TAXON_ID=38298 /ORGANISM="Rhodella maculata, Strain CCMP 736" /LENGTH=815 /DNA_ID=CAMNT_0027177149 /DNA_START=134 /DNA_END=2581 /DNA_ORIENTATION=+
MKALPSTTIDSLLSFMDDLQKNESLFSLSFEEVLDVLLLSNGDTGLKPPALERLYLLIRVASSRNAEFVRTCRKLLVAVMLMTMRSIDSPSFFRMIADLFVSSLAMEDLQLLGLLLGISDPENAVPQLFKLIMYDSAEILDPRTMKFLAILLSEFSLSTQLTTLNMMVPPESAEPDDVRMPREFLNTVLNQETFQNSVSMCDDESEVAIKKDLVGFTLAILDYDGTETQGYFNALSPSAMCGLFRFMSGNNEITDVLMHSTLLHLYRRLDTPHGKKLKSIRGKEAVESCVTFLFCTYCAIENDSELDESIILANSVLEKIMQECGSDLPTSLNDIIGIMVKRGAVNKVLASGLLQSTIPDRGVSVWSNPVLASCLRAAGSVVRRFGMDVFENLPSTLSFVSGVLKRNPTAELIDSSVVYFESLLHHAPDVCVGDNFDDCCISFLEHLDRDNVIQLLVSMAETLKLRALLQCAEACLKVTPSQINDVSHKKAVLGLIEPAILKAKRSELRTFSPRILTTLLKILETRHLAGRETGGEIDEFYDLEKRAAKAISELSLRLNEEDFKVVVVAILEWEDGFRDGDDPSKSVRLAFLEVMRCLLDSISVFFAPYFLPLVEQCLKDSIDAASHSETDSQRKKKKRKLKTSGEAAILAKTGELSLLCVAKFLSCCELGILGSELFDNTVATCRTVVEQCCSKSSFESPLLKWVGEALSTLARRSVEAGESAAGNARLAAVNRAAWALSRDESAGARKCSLTLARRIVDAMRERYLEVLPETLPWIAEVVEDEDSAVAEEAKAFVDDVENISGESIWEHLSTK